MTATPTRQEDPMPADRVREILDRITRVRVAVCGDFCLDAYWMLNPRGGEVSAETGLPAQAVGRHYYSLGGAANVVANVAALRPAQHPGDRRRRRRHLRPRAAAAASRPRRRYGGDGRPARAVRHGHVRQALRRRRRRAAPRLRVLQRAQPRRPTRRCWRTCAQALEQCDAVIFNQQVPGGLSEAFIDGLNALARRVSADGSSCAIRGTTASRFRHIHRKTNDAEAARLNGVTLEPAVHPSLADLESYATRLFAESGKPVFVTRGARGILTVADTGVHIEPGIQLLGEDRYRRRRRHGHQRARPVPRRRALACRGGGLCELRRGGHRAEALQDGHRLAGGGARRQRRTPTTSTSRSSPTTSGRRRISTAPRSRPAASPCPASPTSATRSSTTTARSARCGRAGNGSWSR